jgi:hypothetical protein
MVRNLEFGCATRATHASSENKDKHQAHKSNGSGFECSYNKSTTMVREKNNHYRKVASLSTALMWEHS